MPNTRKMETTNRKLPEMHRIEIEIHATIKENAPNSARTEFLKQLSMLTDLSLKKQGIACNILKSEVPVAHVDAGEHS